MMKNLNLMFGRQVEKSMGSTLLTSLFMRFIAELKQLHQYDLKQMGLTPFFSADKVQLDVWVEGILPAQSIECLFSGQNQTVDKL